MTTTVNGDDLLSKINPVLKESRVQICLRPDLIDRWETLNEELVEAQAKTAGGRLNSEGAPSAEVKKVAKQILDLEVEIEASSAWFVFRAMSAHEYRALCAEHAPRKDNQVDAMVGYDRDAVADILIRRCLVDPVFSDEGWAKFLATCSPTDWNALRDTVFEANGGSVVPPKSQLASQVLSKRGRISA